MRCNYYKIKLHHIELSYICLTAIKTKKNKVVLQKVFTQVDEHPTNKGIATLSIIILTLIAIAIILIDLQGVYIRRVLAQKNKCKKTIKRNKVAIEEHVM